MRKMNFFLTEQQIAALRRQAKITGLKVSDLVRRAIDDFLARLRK